MWPHVWPGLHNCIKYALGCYRHFEMNPVLAHMVKRPIDYRWSSYASNEWKNRDDVTIVTV